MKPDVLDKLKRYIRKLKREAGVSPHKQVERQPQLDLSETRESTLGSPQALAYQLIGNRTAPFVALFRGLDHSLQKSGIKITFKAYVSLTMFTALVSAVSTLIVIPCLAFFAFEVPLAPAFLFGVGGSLFSLAFCVIGFCAYPSYCADKLKRDLEDELAFTTGYMEILAGAGVSPERIFDSLSSLAVPLAITREAQNIMRHVSLFGQDIISSLSEASKRTSSEQFREMLEGYISTVHSGGNSTAYLHEKSRQYMKLKRISLKKFSDTLSVLSEFYVAVLLTGPLLLVIMLAVMAMLGGGNLGLLSPNLLLGLLTYLALPIGGIVFLIILDAVTPKW